MNKSKSNQHLNNLFIKVIENDTDFREAVSLVRKNSSGNIWLIGGFLYQNLVAEIYGLTKKKAKDIDFIVEKPADKIILPNNWIKEKTGYNNPKFIKNDGLIVDLIPLNEVNSIIRRNLPVTIENYLTGTPLNIQSMVFNVDKSEIFGDIGIKALSNKIIVVNNVEEAKINSEHKKKPINQIIKEKAKALGFSFTLS